MVKLHEKHSIVVVKQPLSLDKYIIEVLLDHFKGCKGSYHEKKVKSWSFGLVQTVMKLSGRF